MYTVKMMSKEGSSEGISSLVLRREAKQIRVVKEDVWKARWKGNAFSLALATPDSKWKIQRQLRCAELLPSCRLDNITNWIFPELMTGELIITI